MTVLQLGLTARPQSRLGSRKTLRCPVALARHSSLVAFMFGTTRRPTCLFPSSVEELDHFSALGDIQRQKPSPGPPSAPLVGVCPEVGTSAAGLRSSQTSNVVLLAAGGEVRQLGALAGVVPTKCSVERTIACLTGGSARLIISTSLKVYNL